MTYSEEEQEVLVKIPKWIEDANKKKSKKKKPIEFPEWWEKEYDLKVLYSSKFKRKPYLEVIRYI